MLLPPIFIFTRAHLILAMIFTCLQYEAWKFCKIITDHLVVIWTFYGPLGLSNCHLFHQVAHQNDQSKSLVLVRKGRFMRLGQFSCSNHDVGSSTMMASLCIHRENKNNNNKLLQLYGLEIPQDLYNGGPPLLMPKTETFNISRSVVSTSEEALYSLCLICCCIFFRKPCW